eukprot:CAMPEP_0172451458 /NCGR_PEP_ID=MMETSP1065-20121228/9506_1 /TAXON_ID=265537 /ORGANISM="Amphiprora paludosa, Strain CCMP125" /LENGTH=229 /DNA_ID=CAMNT_0013203419 /DNA_START=18 /DNA_END=707 /DNA_ORIENTATION=+
MKRCLNFAKIYLQHKPSKLTTTARWSGIDSSTCGWLSQTLPVDLIARSGSSSRFLTTSSTTDAASPFDRMDHSVNHGESKPKRRRRREMKFVPLKPAVDLSSKARQFFLQLLENPPRPAICGVRLNYSQAGSGEPRMVFSFSFVTKEELDPFDEAVPLLPLKDDQDASKSDGNGGDIDETETSKEKKEKPTLYVSGNAFLKVLGATVDVDENFLPVLYDKEGNRMDPNA